MGYFVLEVMITPITRLKITYFIITKKEKHNIFNGGRIKLY